MIKALCKKAKGNKGFSLIELIIVIAIIAVLALILVPRFGGFRERAESAADTATARTIETAVMTMITEGDLSLGSGTGDGSFQIYANTDVQNVSGLAQNEDDIEDGLIQLIGTGVNHSSDSGYFEVTIRRGSLDVIVTPRSSEP